MKMIQKISTASLAAATYLTLAVPAFAVTLCPEDASFAPLCTAATEGNIGTVIGRVITAILVIAVVLALFFLIWGGVKWIMSGGDKAKVESARGTIIAAIVGLIIAFLAFFIISLVLQLFGLGGITEFDLPSIFGTGVQ
jgi:hypothetical protein